MALTKESISGLYTAIVTPFKPDMTVDFDAVTMLVKRQVSAGAAGIFPIGSTGEYPNLSRQERRDIVATCVDAAGEAPVMPGVLASGYADSLDAARDFKEVGASAVMLVTPFYTTGTPDGGGSMADSSALFIGSSESPGPVVPSGNSARTPSRPSASRICATGSTAGGSRW